MQKLDSKVLETLTVEQVESVYQGWDGKCCCGCAGTHYRDEANIKRILRSMKREAAKGGEVDYGPGFISRVKGPRLYIVYPLQNTQG